MFIEKEIKDGVLFVRLNRPDKRNSFHPQMIEELTQTFSEAAKNSQLKAIELSGQGKSFCSGADLGWMQSMIHYNFEENYEDSKKLYEMFLTIYQCDLPLLIRAHGHVMGGALGLLAVADVVALEEKTQLAFSEVKLGLVPAVISSFILEKMDSAKAQQYMLSGEVFNAHQAMSSGLVHFVGEESSVQRFCEDLLTQWRLVDTEAVKATKGLIRKVLHQGVYSEKVKELSCRVIADRRVSDSAQRRLKSFLAGVKK